LPLANWHSGKTCALAKLALWQNWRSGNLTFMTKFVKKQLALWQNWCSGKLANYWRSGKTD
jgi:hypothetical protein